MIAMNMPASGSAKAGPRRWPVWPVAATVLISVGGALPVLLLSSAALAFGIAALIEALMATSVGFLARQTGRITFGQAGFFGLAAYLTAILFNQRSLGPELAVLAALTIPTFVGFGLGLVIARVPSIAHAMLTLAVGQGLYEVAFKWREFTNGDDGLTVAPPASLFGVSARSFESTANVYVICWIALVLTVLGLFVFSRSRLGRLTEAIRDNAERTRFLGYDILLPSAVVYAISTFVAALAGVLFTVYNLFVSPGVLHWSTSGIALVMAIIGGYRYLVGPAVGTFAYLLVKEVVGDVSDLWPVVVGTFLIIVTLVAPNGLVGLVRQALAPGRR